MNDKAIALHNSYAGSTYAGHEHPLGYLFKAPERRPQFWGMRNGGIYRHAEDFRGETYHAVGPECPEEWFTARALEALASLAPGQAVKLKPVLCDPTPDLFAKDRDPRWDTAD